MRSHSVTVTFYPTQVNTPAFTPASQAGTRFTYPGPGGMEGWVDLATRWAAALWTILAASVAVIYWLISGPLLVMCGSELVSIFELKHILHKRRTTLSTPSSLGHRSQPRDHKNAGWGQVGAFSLVRRKRKGSGKDEQKKKEWNKERKKERRKPVNRIPGSRLSRGII